MTPDQIRIHLELQGWEAWVEHPCNGARYNLTHPAHGTVWVVPGTRIGKHMDNYRYGFESALGRAAVDADRIALTSVVDNDLLAMWAKIQEVCHES